MRKFFRSFIIIIPFILAACTTHNLQSNQNNKIPLNQLINHLPGKDSVTSTLIFNAILDYGDLGIVEIGKQLESENQENQIKAKWALNGLAVFLTNRERKSQRDSFVSGLQNVLDLPLNDDNKAFVISQFQIVGGSESVSILLPYLDDQNLYEPAIQSLTVIGTESAGEGLLKALPKSDSNEKVSVISALGTIQYVPACEKILMYLEDSNISIQLATAFALSNCGYSPAKKPLSSLAQNDARFVSSYLKLAEKLGEKGEVETCLAICNDILENKSNQYPDNIRINSLRIKSLYNLTGSKDDFFRILSGNNKRMRIAVLELIDEHGTKELVSELIAKAPNKSIDTQVEIIEVLGRKKDDSVNSFLKKSLKSPSSEIRFAAIKILSETQDFEEFPELITVLQDSLDDNEQKQFQNILLSNADSSEIDYLMKYFYNFSHSSQIILIDIISLRRYTSYQNIFLECLNDTSSALRLAAVSGLKLCGNDSCIIPLVSVLLESDNEEEKIVVIKAISALINRSHTRNKQIKLINDYYNKSTMDKKILFFRIFRNVGSKDLMSLLADEVQNKNADIRDGALQNLSEWPNPDALDMLIDIGKTAQSERTRILALRGALRILKENQMGEQRALSYYKEIMKVVTRPEEKRQILAGLAEIRTVSSFNLISLYLNDPEVNHEAFLAAISVSSKPEGESEYLSREEIVASLLQSVSDKELSKKINTYAQGHFLKPKPPEGFHALFNGINLNGWKGLVENPVKRAEMSDDELREAQVKADRLMNEHWQVIDGILYFDGEGSHLCTVNDYTNYELFVDWKIEKKGDSGIYLRGSPQVQIWDPVQWSEGSGGLYNNQKHPNKPLQPADNPIGEWNTFHIIQKGDKVTVYLNEILVVNDVVMENFWEREKSIYPSGQIELQSHNTPLYFKNIFIRELDPEIDLFNGPLYNGKDLNGWQVFGNSLDSWTAKDDILFTTGKGGGWISTIDEYANFILNLEYRMSEGGNSGVFLRAPQEGDPAYTGLEIQILDDYADQYSNLKAWQYTGSIYGLESPAQRVSKISGEWQKMEIVCDGFFIKVVLNDTQIIDANLIDFMHKEQDHPGIKRRKGYIGLQNHSTIIEFRNIIIRELKE